MHFNLHSLYSSIVRAFFLIFQVYFLQLVKQGKKCSVLSPVNINYSENTGKTVFWTVIKTKSQARKYLQ